MDDYPFDLGYYQAFAIVVFCTGLVFSGVIPIISIFLCIFYYFRYYIDKYNLIFVYNREFEGGGIIVKKQVLPLMILSLYLFQVYNLAYFGIINPYFFKGGIIFLSVQSLVLLFIKIYMSNKKRQDRIRLAQVEEVMFDNDEEGINNKRKHQEYRANSIPISVG